MRPNFIILMIIVTLGLGSAYYLRNTAPSQKIHYGPIDTEIPEFKRQRLASFSIRRLSDQKLMHMPDDSEGKILLLNFWASWCAPCVAEFPLLIDIAERYADDLILMGLSSDMNLTAIDRFFKKISYTPRPNEWMAHDAMGTVTSGRFQVYMLPETLLVDQKGDLIRKYVGFDWSEDEMIADIEKLLQK
jgi:thiol-disulfide isomerase/thioredoxin